MPPAARRPRLPGLSGRRGAEVAEVAELEQRVERLRARVRRLEARERRRTRPDLTYLFVMTYGRSGSTLVQGLLNSLPGYLIRGENRNMVHSLFEYHHRGVALSQQRGRRPTQPWFGAQGFPPETSVEEIRALVLRTLLRPRPGTRVTGFKEIRWRGEDLPAYVDFLREVFPGARFVVNTRDLDAVSRSKWWADDEEAPRKLAAAESGILAVAEALGDAAYRIHYDEYVADPDVLRGLFEWLGEPWDPDLVRETMSVRHSY